jgi:hypothetical protein
VNCGPCPGGVGIVRERVDRDELIARYGERDLGQAGLRLMMRLGGAANVVATPNRR